MSETTATDASSSDAESTPPLPIDVLPHRPPFLLIDEVLEVDGLRATSVRTFREDEEFFKGHFPGNPIVPGVLLLEAMAQTFAYLAMREEGVKGVYLTGIERARFRKPVLPGQRVEFTVEVEGVRLGVMRGHADARVDGVRVADAHIRGLADRGEVARAD